MSISRDRPELLPRRTRRRSACGRQGRRNGAASKRAGRPGTASRGWREEKARALLTALLILAYGLLLAVRLFPTFLDRHGIVPDAEPFPVARGDVGHVLGLGETTAERRVLAQPVYGVAELFAFGDQYRRRGELDRRSRAGL